MTPLDPAWITLSLVERLGGKTFAALLAQFGSPAAVLAADEAALRRVRGIGPKLAAAIRAADPAAVERALPRWSAAGVQLFTWDDAAYPPRLLDLPDAPPTLFVRGDAAVLRGPSAAVVGTRSPSAAARQLASDLALVLAARGYLIVSGLALGVDSAAHIGALADPAGHTAAVLGSGLLRVYPPGNMPLAEAVARRGALLSETHPDAEPNVARLVARNRLIAALAETLIVVETGVEGGAMYAARFAAALGRSVQAVNSPASGNRALIAAGAVPLRPDLSDLHL
jgi:DNA processing protein